ncbi:hypothetical protein SIN8267_01914 [Sinobacterium norvegicum]|uniref:DUF484 family protein n=2 Tax=Sinobacterium norvegicum TaxID=1641715 RepID=A0ABM9AF18_9GAMM|nr:hypothetical protein SIN8267_01914 [Sinobacterium norvegicum]
MNVPTDKTTRADNDEAITAEQVTEYLKQHPDFFILNDELIANLYLPHDEGEAISLQQHQVTTLRQRNENMRQRLLSLLDVAKENDQLFNRTKNLVLALLDAQDLDHAVSIVNHSLTTDFNADFCALTLFGNTERYQYCSARVVPVFEAQQQVGHLLRSSRAVCGVLRPNELEFLFEDDAKLVGSAAVSPLTYGNNIGVLAIGSRDENYFRSSMGTLFLSYVSEVLNRTLPRFMNQYEKKSA